MNGVFMNKFKLVLVRHGHSLGNKENLLSGWSDVPLTDEGKEELRQLKNIVSYPKTKKYYSSDLQRAYDTFKILFSDHVSIDLVNERYREIHFGKYENKSSNEINFKQFFEAWLSDQEIEEGENYSNFAKRINQNLYEDIFDLMSKDIDSLTIVCHSGVIKTILIELQKKSPFDFKFIEVGNGLGYVIDYEFDEKNVINYQILPLHK